MAGLEAQMLRRTRWSVLAFAAAVVALVVSPGAAGVALLVLAVVTVLASGPFQAHVALNPALREEDRTRWRVALWLVPGAMVLHRHRHARRPVD